MHKFISILIVILLISTGSAFGAKYKVNTSGSVKSKGKIVSPSGKPSNPYNVYTTGNYVASKQVMTAQVQTIELVMDYSGSMANCITEAKKAMRSIIAQVPSSVNIGFRVFGHNYNGFNPNNKSTIAPIKKIVKKNGKYQVTTEDNSCVGSTTGRCSATEQVAPIARANANSILAGMNSVRIGGATPLVYALDRAVNQDFLGLDTSYPKKIVLITDGGENCGGDPCAFAEQLMRRRTDIQIDVVLVYGGSFSGLSCLANKTGGKVYKVNDLSNFSSVLTQSVTAPATQKPQQQKQQYEFYND